MWLRVAGVGYILVDEKGNLLRIQEFKWMMDDNIQDIRSGWCHPELQTSVSGIYSYMKIYTLPYKNETK